jgi:hypothetical protein
MRAQRLTTIIFIGMLIGVGIGPANAQVWQKIDCVNSRLHRRQPSTGGFPRSNRFG